MYYKQITLFDMICRDGNMLINLNELNAQDVVRKLLIIEKDSQTVWNALEKVYGYGCFNKIIEDEFGISPDF